VDTSETIRRVSDWLSLVVFVACGGVVVAVSRWLGGGTFLSLDGLFGTPNRRDWPRRVQEGDAPRFDVVHLDDLRPGTPALIARGDAGDGDELGTGPRPEVFDLGSRRIDDR
jgi:hypothetical protein